MRGAKKGLRRKRGKLICDEKSASQETLIARKVPQGKGDQGGSIIVLRGAHRLGRTQKEEFSKPKEKGIQGNLS